MKIRSTLILFFSLFSMSLFAQENTLDERDPVAMIKAAIIFQFAYQSEWPDSETSDFVIGVYGNEVIYQQLLDKYATQPIGDQILKIRKIENLSDCSDVQIVFIDRSKEEDLKKAQKEISNLSVLLISDVEDSVSKGAAVGFVVQDSKTKFRLNEKEAEKRKISIGKMLKEWAVKTN